MYTFLLAGNGDFRNHGCEAIARGTEIVLQNAFGNSYVATYAAHSRHDAVEAEVALLSTDRYTGIPFISPFDRLSPEWFQHQINRTLSTSFPAGFKNLLQTIKESDAVLAIGGDNYSLDYGYPETYIQFDNLCLKHRRPLVYWCASVGPFSADASYERRIRKHLYEISAILVRESSTVCYLNSLGIHKNVHLVADPGFVMPGVMPDETKQGTIPSDYIAVNFSTTVGRLLLDNQRESDSRHDTLWLEKLGKENNYENLCRRYAEIASSLVSESNMDLVFVPHVTGGMHCDFAFMQDISDEMVKLGYPRPYIAPPNLSAPEYKYIISRSRVFIGARTHSTIAAFSSGVPTVCLSYSMKARGISGDMYGTTEYCIPGSEVSSERLLPLVMNLLENEQHYRDKLHKQAELMCSRAYLAGSIVANLLSDENV